LPVGDELADAVAGDEERLAIAADDHAVGVFGEWVMGSGGLEEAAVGEDGDAGRVMNGVVVTGGRLKVGALGRGRGLGNQGQTEEEQARSHFPNGNAGRVKGVVKVG
jgi:hypothetical protein